MNVNSITALATGCLVAPLLTHALFGQQGQEGSDAPQRTTANNSQAEKAPKILNSLEGVWEVEVEVNPRQWGKHVGHDSKDGSGMRPEGRDDGQRNPGQRDDGSTTGRDAGGGGGQGAGQGTDRSGQMGKSAPAQQMVKGIALAESVLGGDILAMSSLMSKSDPMKGSSKDSASDSNDRGKVVTDEPGSGSADADRRSDSDDKAWTAPSNDAELMRSVSYFAFDPNTQQYSAVFMSDMDGAMHYATGQYDSSSKRIVFNSSNTQSGERAKRLGDESRGVVDAAAPRSDMGSKSGQQTAVLRMLDDQSFEVTMYLGGNVPAADASSDRRDAARRDAARRDADGGQDATGSTGGQKDDGNGQDDKDWANSKAEQQSLPANVLYRATYKRASGERARQCIEEMQKDQQRRRDG